MTSKELGRENNINGRELKGNMTPKKEGELG